MHSPSASRTFRMAAPVPGDRDSSRMSNRIEWLSQLNAEPSPDHKLYRRTSIICTIGRSFVMLVLADPS
jgi:hypothetical protein